MWTYKCKTRETLLKLIVEIRSHNRIWPRTKVQSKTLSYLGSMLQYLLESWIEGWPWTLTEGDRTKSKLKLITEDSRRWPRASWTLVPLMIGSQAVSLRMNRNSMHWATMWHTRSTRGASRRTTLLALKILNLPLAIELTVQMWILCA